MLKQVQLRNAIEVEDVFPVILFLVYITAKTIMGVTGVCISIYFLLY